jgi:hypothetical protein
MAELNNVRHEKFAQGLASGMSQRNAYRAAFPKSNRWKDETVDPKASALAKTDKVMARLKELAAQATSEAVMNAKQRKEWLTSIIRSEAEETKDKLKAVDILNRMDGEYVDKVQLAGQVNNPMAGLTTEELKKLINDG